MKKIHTLKTLIMVFSLAFFAFGKTYAQNEKKAREILDKTSVVVGAPSGVHANFKVSSTAGISTSGNISIKKNKFCASTTQATIWYDGTTQWTYLKNNNEVNITKPNAAKQASMNPYAFINLYKKGYKLDYTATKTDYKVHLKATDAAHTLKELYITINKHSYVPSVVKFLQNNAWTTISINNFQARNIADKAFTFNSKDFPTAEVIDLR